MIERVPYLWPYTHMTGLIFKSVLMKLMTDLTDCYFVADVMCALFPMGHWLLLQYSRAPRNWYDTVIRKWWRLIDPWLRLWTGAQNSQLKWHQQSLEFLMRQIHVTCDSRFVKSCFSFSPKFPLSATCSTKTYFLHE